VASPADNLFAPPTDAEMGAAKAAVAARGARGPAGPVDLFAPPSDEELLAAKTARPMPTGLINKQNVQGELGGVDRTVLGFASGDKEKAAYLKKKYPKIEIAQMDTGEKNKDGTPKTVMVFKQPGEARYQYIDDPSLTWTDAADFVGDVPSAVLGMGAAALAAPTGPGAIAAGAAGAGAGEVARKAIGRGLLGIPNEQSLGEDAMDVGISTAAGAVFPAGLTAAKGLLNRGAKVAASEAADIGKQAVKEGAESMAPKAANAAQDLGTAELSINNPDQLAKYIAGQESRMEAPKTTAELVKALHADQAAGKATSLPSKAELEGALSRLKDLETKPTAMHLAALDSRQAADIAGVRKILPSVEAEALNYHEQKMKAELVDKFRNVVAPLAKRDPLKPAESGETLIEAVKNRYSATKKNLTPEFDKLRDMPSDPVRSLPALQDKIAAAIPGLAKHLKIIAADAGTPEELAEGLASGEIRAMLAPYKPSMGISKESHKLINEVLADVSTPKTFKEMQNIRETLRKALDPANPKATRELESLRGAMLEHMADLAAEQNPGVNVRSLFQAYAQNEGRLELAQKLFKGTIGSNDASKRPSAEKVLDSVFLNQKTVQMAREAFGDQEVATLAHDLINAQVEAATKQGNVSSAQLQKFLRAKMPVLEEAFRGIEPSSSKAITQRMRDLVDVLRTVPDAAPVNPSGTAKTSAILGSLAKGGRGLITGNPGEVAGAAKGLIGAVGDARASSGAAKQLDEILKGIPPEERGKGLIRKGMEAASEAVQKPAARGLIGSQVSGTVRPEREQEKKKK